MSDAYTEEELDALREIVNVAIGRAGSTLARILDQFVRIPVPRIRMVSADNVIDVMRELIADTEPLSAVRQAFYGREFGEAIALFNDDAFHEVTEILSGSSPASEEEQLLDVSNILIGVCIESLAEQLGSAVSYSPPRLMFRHGTLERVLAHDASWQTALLIEVSFRLEGRSLVSHVLAFWPDAALAELHLALVRCLEAL